MFFKKLGKLFFDITDAIYMPYNMYSTCVVMYLGVVNCTDLTFGSLGYSPMHTYLLVSLSINTGLYAFRC